MAVRAVESDGDWKVLSILNDTYHITMPGTFEWVVSQRPGYTWYQGTLLYEGRIYTIWIRRFPPDSPTLADPQYVDDSAGAFALVHQAPTQRHDLVVGRGVATGRAAIYRYERGGLAYFESVVAFRVNDDVILQAITSRPALAPVALWRRMNDGFSLGTGH